MEFENTKKKWVLLVMVPDEKYLNSAELNNTKSVLGVKLIIIYLQVCRNRRKLWQGSQNYKLIICRYKFTSYFSPKYFTS